MCVWGGPETWKEGDLFGWCLCVCVSVCVCVFGWYLCVFVRACVCACVCVCLHSRQGKGEGSGPRSRAQSETRPLCQRHFRTTRLQPNQRHVLYARDISGRLVSSPIRDTSSMPETFQDDSSSAQSSDRLSSL